MNRPQCATVPRRAQRCWATVAGVTAVVALAALVPLGLARPGPAAAGEARAVRAPTARPPVAHRVEPGDGTTPLAAALFVRDGQVRVYCPTGEMDVRPGIVQPVVLVAGYPTVSHELPAWQAPVATDGAVGQGGGALAASVGSRGWDCSGLCVLQRGDEQVVFSEEWGESYGCVAIAYRRADGNVERRPLAVPGYAAPGTEYERPRDCCALSSGSPSGALVGEHVWLVSSRSGADVVLSRCEWGRWTVHDWAIAQSLGEGMRPDLAAVDGGRLFVAYVHDPYPARLYSEGGARGAVYLTRSADGEAWSAPTQVLDGTVAHFVALAGQADVGLVLLYVADEPDGQPLYAVRSADLGATWGEPLLLTDRHIRCLDPDALIDGGRLYISYRSTSMDAPGSMSAQIPTPDAVYALALDPNDLPVK